MKQAIATGAGYFGAVFAAGFLLGVVRTLWLAPALGPTWAVALELPVMLGVSWLVCARILRRWPAPTHQAAVMGITAFVLLMAAEAGLSTLLAGRSLREHLALYGQAPHLLGLLGQAGFACIPWLQVRWVQTPTQA